MIGMTIYDPKGSKRWPWVVPVKTVIVLPEQGHKMSRYNNDYLEFWGDQFLRFHRDYRMDGPTGCPLWLKKYLMGRKRWETAWLAHDALYQAWRSRTVWRSWATRSWADRQMRLLLPRWLGWPAWCLVRLFGGIV